MRPDSRSSRAQASQEGASSDVSGHRAVRPRVGLTRCSAGSRAAATGGGPAGIPVRAERSVAEPEGQRHQAHRELPRCLAPPLRARRNARRSAPTGDPGLHRRRRHGRNQCRGHRPLPAGSVWNRGWRRRLIYLPGVPTAHGLPQQDQQRRGNALDLLSHHAARCSRQLRLVHRRHRREGHLDRRAGDRLHSCGDGTGHPDCSVAATRASPLGPPGRAPPQIRSGSGGVPTMGQRPGAHSSRPPSPPPRRATRSASEPVCTPRRSRSR